MIEDSSLRGEGERSFHSSPSGTAVERTGGSTAVRGSRMNRRGNIEVGIKRGGEKAGLGEAAPCLRDM